LGVFRECTITVLAYTTSILFLLIIPSKGLIKVKVADGHDCSGLKAASFNAKGVFTFNGIKGNTIGLNLIISWGQFCDQFSVPSDRDGRLGCGMSLPAGILELKVVTLSFEIKRLGEVSVIIKVKNSNGASRSRPIRVIVFKGTDCSFSGRENPSIPLILKISINKQI
jgi:hypothetical protein